MTAWTVTPAPSDVVSNPHREFVMTKVKTLCASGALLLIGSTVALAQTITPPPSGSHPDLATQPDSRAAEPSSPLAAVPPSLQEGVPALAVQSAGPKAGEES